MPPKTYIVVKFEVLFEDLNPPERKLVPERLAAVTPLAIFMTCWVQFPSAMLAFEGVNF